MMVLATGICWPELKVASTLLRTSTDGADSTVTSDTVSSALTTACALGPTKVKLLAALEITLPTLLKSFNDWLSPRLVPGPQSEERRVGKEWVSKGKLRGRPD